MKIKILTIQEKEVDNDVDRIHINHYKYPEPIMINKNRGLKPEFNYCEERIYHKRYYIIDNDKIELFPSCSITNFLLQLHEDMNHRINNLEKENFDLRSLINKSNDKINKLKKSFLKRLLFLFKGD